MAWRDRLRRVASDPSANCYPSANCDVSANSRKREPTEGQLAQLAQLADREELAEPSQTHPCSALDALIADTAARARAATAPPADAEDAAEAVAERAALVVEGEGATLIREAAPAEPWPELAELSPGCTTAVRITRDDFLEVKHRLPSGEWGASEVDTTPAHWCAPVVIGPNAPTKGSVCTACGGGTWWRGMGATQTAWRCQWCFPVESMDGLEVAP